MTKMRYFMVEKNKKNVKEIVISGIFDTKGLRLMALGFIITPGMFFVFLTALFGTDLSAEVLGIIGAFTMLCFLYSVYTIVRYYTTVRAMAMLTVNMRKIIEDVIEEHAEPEIPSNVSHNVEELCE